MSMHIDGEKWCEDIIFNPPINSYKCIECGNTLSLPSEDNPVLENSYYYNRHIPPELIITCSECDTDNIIKLNVIIQTEQ